MRWGDFSDPMIFHRVYQHLENPRTLQVVITFAFPPNIASYNFIRIPIPDNGLDPVSGGGAQISNSSDAMFPTGFINLR